MKEIPLRFYSVNVSKSAVSCGFGHICWRNPQWKTSFFMQCWYILLERQFSLVFLTTTLTSRSDYTTSIFIYHSTWESGFNVIFICLWEFYGSLRHLGNQSKFRSAKKIEYSIFYSNRYLRCIKPTTLWMLSKSYLKFQI